MAVNLAAPGELLLVPGVRLAAASAQVKVSAAPDHASGDDTSPGNAPAERDDVAVVELCAGSTVAGVFTPVSYTHLTLPTTPYV